MGSERLTGPGLSLDCSLVPWDTRALGFPVAQIDAIELRRDADPAPTVELFRAWLDERRVGLVSCRLDSLRLPESMLLEDLGFRFIEMVYSPVLSPLTSDPGVDADVVIEPVEGDDGTELQEVAASVFTTGRHVLDPRLDPAAGQRRYRGWLAGALADAGQDVLRAKVGEETVGFFVVERRADDVVYWHLTAVVPAWQGRSVGKQLWRTIIARHREAGVRRIETTISAHNIAVVNLYAGLGFRFTAPRATFHWVRA